MAHETWYEGVVEKVFSNGCHGPYAVASHKKLGSITFSLGKKCWLENDWPEPGTYVMLSGLTKKRAGWRASVGRFLDPSDEQQQGS